MPRPIPAGERSIEEQLASLSPSERAAVDTLKQKWESQPRDHQFDDAMYLRFARCSPGNEKFNVKAAYKVMQKYDGRYLTLTAADLEEQLLTKTLFIPPGLESNEGHACFYMRPSRYFPKKTSTSTIIDNLAYCMSCMVESSEKSCTEGIGFVANMDDWSFTNFSVSYCLNFMKMLQGRIPVRVRLFLIVNPPSWFGSIWDIMKPMLAKDFRKKVHMIPAADLPKFLADGFEQHLPDELAGGQTDPTKIVENFIEQRKTIEGA